jgi:hypothetical protein
MTLKLMKFWRETGENCEAAVVLEGSMDESLSRMLWPI